MRSLPAIALAALALAACATSPGARALETADFGAEPGSGLQSRVREAFTPLLLHPGGAEFRCKEPERGWGHDQRGFVYGYVVWTEVNAKNQFGAFTGWQAYKVLTRDGEVHSIYEPQGEDLFGKPKFRKVR